MPAELSDRTVATADASEGLCRRFRLRVEAAQRARRRELLVGGDRLSGRFRLGLKAWAVPAVKPRPMRANPPESSALPAIFLRLCVVIMSSPFPLLSARRGR